MASDIYDIDLDRNPANHQPLTPLSFLERAAQVYPDHTAIVHGKTRSSYAEFYARSRKLASALAARAYGSRATAEMGIKRVVFDIESGVHARRSALICEGPRYGAVPPLLWACQGRDETHLRASSR